MSDRMKLSLLRALMIIVTIVGAVYVFGVIVNLREGGRDALQLVLGLLVIAALVWMNRWWFQRSGTRL